MSELAKVFREWASCEKCELHLCRQSIVIGEADSLGGRTPTRLMVIGEAPGRIEDETGRPFVGTSGDLLRNEILGPAGANLVFFTNAVACRPVSNQDPTLEEIDCCAPRVRALIDAGAPDAILMVGRLATNAFLEGKYGETPFPVVHIKHPAWVLRQGPVGGEVAQRLIAGQIDKVKGLIHEAESDLGVDSSKPVCNHEFVEVGTATLKGKTKPLQVCLKCAALEALH